ncbi:hypothetical protein HYE59_05875 [Aggregatibacter actinomycetemcomitans]|uniref:hypothetical protein n=1 Tax=Aggregatibacter actinomycetemcomitans TaxID=714 RepID=UPI00197C0176|nr:hypothetical protein [Aggregatibacter actinomycetemcomitans]MBN6077072.1 hypothetical protein [Aggregatibacter actinomycetemcomitans]
MSTYQDINSNKLYYTEELGWIDASHANGHGASNLLTLIKNEGSNTAWVKDPHYFCIEYYQDMSRYFLNSGLSTFWIIRKGLSEAEQKSIALSIFMYVSFGFEAHQGLLSLVTDSGYSCEDLISNLLGFYKSVEPKGYDSFITKYPPKYAKKIWNHYGPVGNFKMRSLKVLYFPDPDNNPNAKPYEKSLPTWLSTITPENLITSDKVKKIMEYQYFGLRVNNKKIRLYYNNLMDMSFD